MLPTRPLILVVVLTLSVVGIPDSVSSSAVPFDQNRSCVGLDPPSDGVISVGFTPGPGYSGHWGVDYQGDSEGYVRAAAGGIVTFSGLVVDNLVVTVDHGGGIKTSYSYLGHATVVWGQRVGRGAVLGPTGAGILHDEVHFSVRNDGEYVDPEPLLGCLPRAPTAGLRLVSIG